MIRKILIEVDYDDKELGTDRDMTFDVMDAVYHVPDVRSVVEMRFRPDSGGGMWIPDEATRIPKS